MRTPSTPDAAAQYRPHINPRELPEWLQRETEDIRQQKHADRVALYSVISFGILGLGALAAVLWA